MGFFRKQRVSELTLHLKVLYALGVLVGRGVRAGERRKGGSFLPPPLDFSHATSMLSYQIIVCSVFPPFCSPASIYHHRVLLPPPPTCSMLRSLAHLHLEYITKSWSRDKWSRPCLYCEKTWPRGGSPCRQGKRWILLWDAERMNELEPFLHLIHSLLLRSIIHSRHDRCNSGASHLIPHSIPMLYIATI